MVCLTSCVFRSIRFSGFARPHVGVRREGELYTHAHAGGKRGRGAPSDAHKSGDNSCLGGFPGPWAPARALGAQGRAGPGRTVRRAYYSSGQALMGLPLFISWRKGAFLGSPLGDPTGRPRTSRRPPAHALQPRHLYGPPPSVPVRPPIESLLPPAQPRPSAGPGPVTRAVKSLRDVVLTESPAKRSPVPSHFRRTPSM